LLLFVNSFIFAFLGSLIANVPALAFLTNIQHPYQSFSWFGIFQLFEFEFWFGFEDFYFHKLVFKYCVCVWQDCFIPARLFPMTTLHPAHVVQLVSPKKPL
jgi:hypothetical protein